MTKTTLVVVAALSLIACREAQDSNPPHTSTSASTTSTTTTTTTSGTGVGGAASGGSGQGGSGTGGSGQGGMATGGSGQGGMATGGSGQGGMGTGGSGQGGMATGGSGQGGMCGGGGGIGGPVVINELFYDAVGSDTGKEWLELYNQGAGPIDIGGWFIQRATTGPFSDRFTIPANTILGGYCYLVVGESDVAAADVKLPVNSTLAFGNASANGDGVRITDKNKVVVDTVVYGPNNNDGIVDDNNAVAKPAAAAKSGESIARFPNGVDTDDSSVDFKPATPSMGAPNP